MRGTMEVRKRRRIKRRSDSFSTVLLDSDMSSVADQCSAMTTCVLYEC